MSGSPAVAYGTVYEGSNDGYLYAWDAKTGTQRWRAPLTSGAGGVPRSVLRRSGLHRLGSTPTSSAFDAFTGDTGVGHPPLGNYTGGAAVANGVALCGDM